MLLPSSRRHRIACKAKGTYISLATSVRPVHTSAHSCLIYLPLTDPRLLLLRSSSESYTLGLHEPTALANRPESPHNFLFQVIHAAASTRFWEQDSWIAHANPVDHCSMSVRRFGFEEFDISPCRPLAPLHSSQRTPPPFPSYTHPSGPLCSVDI